MKNMFLILAFSTAAVAEVGEGGLSGSFSTEKTSQEEFKSGVTELTGSFEDVPERKKISRNLAQENEEEEEVGEQGVSGSFETR